MKDYEESLNKCIVVAKQRPACKLKFMFSAFHQLKLSEHNINM